MNKLWLKTTTVTSSILEVDINKYSDMYKVARDYFAGYVFVREW